MIAATMIVLLTYCTGGGCTSTKRYDMASMEACMESVKNAKVEVSHGGDSEGSVAMYCVPKGSEK